MNDWLRIGQFSKITNISPRALRIYEKKGLLISHFKGENNYRYYQESQIELAQKIQTLKMLGFSLDEIKNLTQANASIDSEELEFFLTRRLNQVLTLQNDLSRQRDQIEKTLSSLKKKDNPLNSTDRRYIMSHFGNVSFVVTGLKDLEKTANLISSCLSKGERQISILKWHEGMVLPELKPYILVLPEFNLHSEEVSKINPDVVVIKDISDSTLETEKLYLNLYSDAGPHMSTVFNADDKNSVKLADNSSIRKGKTFYFSKNKNLESQVMTIGGVIGSENEIVAYRFNLSKEVFKFKSKKQLGFDDEISILASLTAVLDIGLSSEDFRLSSFRVGLVSCLKGF